MIINIILPSFGLSGGVMVALKYAEALEKQGHDVLCYSPRTSYKMYGLNKYKEFKYRVGYFIRNYDIDRAKIEYPSVKMKKVFNISNICVRNADILIATAWNTAYDVNRLNESKGKKVYFIQDYEIWDNQELGKKSYLLPLFHIVIARWIDEVLSKELGCKESSIIYNGIDTVVFTNNRYNRKDNNIKCLMMYHELEKKGISDGIDAYRKAKKSRDNIKLIMFGKRKCPEDIDCIDEYYCDPTREKLVELYNEADIFIYPPKTEGWGLTPLEAMACGCAVVGTETGCMLELGISGENVLLSPPGNVEALYNNLNKMIEDKQLRSTIAENGYLTAQALNWENSFKKFENILKGLL